MRVVVSKLPKTDWWGEGIIAYEDNWAMVDGAVPVQQKVTEQHNKLIKTLNKYVEVVEMPFPNSQEFPDINHDYVFVRDHFVSGNDHSIVICNFKRPERKQETKYTKSFLDSLGIEYETLSDSALAEGGEFQYVPKENFLFAGINRNNRQGIKEMSQKLGVDKTIIVRSKAFHLDTLLTLLFDRQKHLLAMLVCMELVENKEVMINFAEEYDIHLLDLEPIDAIGKVDQTGSQAVNGFVLPGVFINNCEFKTSGVEARLKNMGIERIITPTSEFNLSGGSIHCLTNEL